MPKLRSWCALLALGLLCGMSWSEAASAQAPVEGPLANAGVEIPWSPQMALRQQRQFREALDKLQPHTSGERVIYILSAALWGSHEFESEASKGGAVLAERYGAQERLLVLSNGQGPGPQAYPAATPAHLFASLARVGEVMNPEKDVAIIFLTSHGSPNVGMAIREPGRMEYQLRPAALRAALDNAKIKTRIIVLSACFSGQFIPALQNENTIVLTAAAADKPSFGCSPERDWTYFGDALLNDAMRQPTTPLLEGFERAKTLIASWEEMGGQPASMPQKFVGAKAAAALAAIERGR